MGGKGAFLARFLANLTGSKAETLRLSPAQRLPLSASGKRIELQDSALRIELGARQLDLHPERSIDGSAISGPPDLLVFDPSRYYSGCGHFLRLAPNQKLRIDTRDDQFRAVLSNEAAGGKHKLEIAHEGDALVLRESNPDVSTFVSLLDHELGMNRFVGRRIQALERLIEVYGGPIQALPADTAYDLLREVNGLLEDDPYRARDSRGEPGGVVKLPPAKSVILIGDLHARVDNLLTVLSHNGFLEALDRDEAALVIIGDSVHSDDDETLEDMDSSVLMTDLILKLKQSFPSSVFLLLGNHESFSPEVSKGRVAQGLLWGKRLVELRGDRYRGELTKFYSRCPLVAYSDVFCACHAGPPQSKVTLDAVIDARQQPHLLHDLTWTRQRAPGYPQGYAGGDIRRFKTLFGLGKDAAFIVGHFPRSDTASVWLNTGKVEGHHVVYSSRPHEVGVFTQIEGEMLPQVYKSEPLASWMNDRASSEVSGELPG